MITIADALFGAVAWSSINIIAISIMQMIETPSIRANNIMWSINFVATAILTIAHITLRYLA